MNKAEAQQQRKAIRLAVSAERDRCAKIAEAFAARAHQDGLLVHSQIASELATQIRTTQ